MILLDDLEVYMRSVVERVAALNHFETVLDGEQVNRFIKDLSEETNTMLFLLVPEAGGNGSRQANLEGGTTLEFYLLDKTDYKEGSQEFIRIFKDTQPTAIETVRLIFSDAQSGCHPILQHINFAKYSIIPAAAMSGCNGWYVQLEIRSWL